MLSEGRGLRGEVDRVRFDRKEACRVWECVVSAGDVTPELPVSVFLAALQVLLFLSCSCLDALEGTPSSWLQRSY